MSNVDTEQVVHEYDDIQELDNFLPRWWLLLFYFTIAFGVVYFVYYHVSGKGMLPAEKYEASVAAHEALRAETLAAVPADTNVVASAPSGPLTDAATLEAGKAVFKTHCFACHTETGGGLVGPNLTDAYWIHGPSYEDQKRVVIKGVPEKGMISWTPVLKPAEIEAVCSYIYTLRGTNPPNPKDPEGEHVPGSDDPNYRADADAAATSDG